MSFLDEILRIRDALPPPPRFDRVAIRAMSALDSVPRRKQTLRPSVDEPLHALFGFPVVVDAAVEPGWLELRKGDDVVERVRIA